MNKILDLLSSMFGFKKTTRFPVWDGNAKALPPEGRRFMYKDQIYTWHKCDCGNPFCNRPDVIDENGDPSYSMSIRMRGDNPGFPDVILLEAVGASATEIADAYDGGGKNAWAPLLDKYKDEAVKSGRISESELLELLFMAAITA